MTFTASQILQAAFAALLGRPCDVLALNAGRRISVWSPVESVAWQVLSDWVNDSGEFEP